MVTSTHHQMMIPAPDAIVLLTASICHEKNAPAYSKIGRPTDDDPDIEALFYDGTNCLCFQPHPEMAQATADCVDFFEECLDNFIYPRIPLRENKKMVNAIINQGSVTPA